MATRFTSSSALQFVASGQPGAASQSADLAAALQDICNNCEKALAVRARDAKTYAAWGSALLQLAFITNDNTKKLEQLRLSREKLNRAVDIDSKAMTPDKILAVLELGNAYFMTHLIEPDATMASNFLEKCRTAYKKGSKIDNKTGQELLSKLSNAQSLRSEVQATIQRFQGKTEAEMAAEFGSMIQEQVDKAAQAVEANPECAKTLLAYGQALVDLSLIQERENTPDAMERARASIIKSVEHLSKSVTISGSKEAYCLLALGLNALGMCNDDPRKADALFREASRDEQEAASMLLQLRDMYKTGETWASLHPLAYAQGGEGIFEKEPEELRRLIDPSYSTSTHSSRPSPAAASSKGSNGVKPKRGPSTSRDDLDHADQPAATHTAPVAHEAAPVEAARAGGSKRLGASARQAATSPAPTHPLAQALSDESLQQPSVLPASRQPDTTLSLDIEGGDTVESGGKKKNKRNNKRKKNKTASTGPAPRSNALLVWGAWTLAGIALVGGACWAASRWGLTPSLLRSGGGLSKPSAPPPDAPPSPV